MIVELHNKLRSPKRLEATRVLMRAQNGEPLALAVELNPGQYYLIDRRHDDEEFQQALHSMGIHETFVTTHGELPKPSGKLWVPDSESEE